MNDVFLRLTPFIAMAGIVCLRPLVAICFDRRRRAVEAATLTSMLAAEIESLLAHYDDNVALLSSVGGVPLSMRASGGVFRASSGRLAGLLSEAVLVPLVAVHAHHDRIEALIQACLGGNAGRHVRPNLNQAYLAALRERFLAGGELARRAVHTLNEARSGAASAPTGAERRRYLVQRTSIRRVVEAFVTLRPGLSN